MNLEFRKALENCTGSARGLHREVPGYSSLRLSQDWSAMIVTVNYKLAVDGITIEYGTQEVVDTVKYFLEHAEEYREPTDIFWMLAGLPKISC